MGKVEIQEASREEMERWLPEILEIYAVVRGLSERAIKERREIMRRHFGRRGYRGFIAVDGDRLVGFSYGYTGDPGQYWYDKVWAAMTPEHYEFVELAVHPEYQYDFRFAPDGPRYFVMGRRLDV